MLTKANTLYFQLKFPTLTKHFNIHFSNISNVDQGLDIIFQMFPTLTKHFNNYFSNIPNVDQANICFLKIPNVDQAVFKPKIENVDQS